MPRDRFVGEKGPGIKANLKNLRPFANRHWRKGALGFLLIIFASLFGFPQPLIMRYVVDDVILDRQLELLIGAIVLLIGIALAEKFTKLLEEFFFARLELLKIEELIHQSQKTPSVLGRNGDIVIVGMPLG